MTKPDPTKCYVDGCDPNGIPRVWGTGPDTAGAMDQARLAASEYIARKRRVFGNINPITDWSFNVITIRKMRNGWNMTDSNKYKGI